MKFLNVLLNETREIVEQIASFFTTIITVGGGMIFLYSHSWLGIIILIILSHVLAAFILFDHAFGSFPWLEFENCIKVRKKWVLKCTLLMIPIGIIYLKKGRRI